MKVNKIFGLLVIAGSMLLSSCSSSGTPYIGSNGNWWVDNTDLGVSAKGDKGDKGDTGEKGDKGNDGADGTNGKDGRSIVSIELTSTDGNIDTYTITYSDGTTTTFQVTNGEKGNKGDSGEKGDDGDPVTVTDFSLKDSADGVDTYEITFSNGYKTTFSVTNGKNLSILKVEKIESKGSYDTYRITFSDDSYIDFVVSNGTTPTIGENGHWFIGDEDTGVMAGYSDTDSRTYTLSNKISSAGLSYSLMTINGVSGYVVTGYSSSIAKAVALNFYHEYSSTMTEDEYEDYVTEVLSNWEIIVPNNVGSIPVIGINAEVFESDSSLKSISLSKNTIYLGDSAFKSSGLQSIDFNGCKLTFISDSCFYGTALKEIDLPETVTALYSYAFYDCSVLDDFDYSRITYFGTYSLYGIADEYIWLSKDVTYVGEKAFSKTFVYIENGAITTNWATLSSISYDNYYSAIPVEGCLKNESFIYKYDDDGTIVAYRYLEEETIANIPSQIDNVNITRLGKGFLSHTKRVESATAKSSALSPYKEVIVPNTVTTIDYGALNVYGALVYIPSSVTKMYSGTCTSMGTTYLAFEGSTLPSLVGNDDATVVATSDEWISEATADGIRYSLSLNLSEIEFDADSETFYLNNDTYYSVLACEAIDATSIEIPSTYNNKPVKTIMTSSYAYLTNLKSVKIGSNVTRIQKYSFNHISLIYSIIPSSVAVIGKYGFNNCCSRYYIGASTIPDDWDTYWAGTTSPTVTYSWDTENMTIGFDSKTNMMYQSSGTEITLLSSLNASSTTIVLPSTIDGLPVTSIAKGFVTSGSYKNYYIPLSIVNAEDGAFASSYYNYFYFEASSLPSGFASSWCSGGKYVYYSRTMPTA